jgi:hypothetical protein
MTVKPGYIFGHAYSFSRGVSVLFFWITIALLIKHNSMPLLSNTCTGSLVNSKKLTSLVFLFYCSNMKYILIEIINTVL